ncbi:hypothetical protein GF325_07100 [Candidatus Bathyarchaeota archaeon]|nr:hypothetical protein [Candidatus Bathyarchaeota archaeon]
MKITAVTLELYWGDDFRETIETNTIKIKRENYKYRITYTIKDPPNTITIKDLIPNESERINAVNPTCNLGKEFLQDMSFDHDNKTLHLQLKRIPENPVEIQMGFRFPATVKESIEFNPELNDQPVATNSWHFLPLEPPVVFENIRTYPDGSSDDSFRLSFEIRNLGTGERRSFFITGLPKKDQADLKLLKIDGNKPKDEEWKFLAEEGFLKIIHGLKPNGTMEIEMKVRKLSSSIVNNQEHWDDLFKNTFNLYECSSKEESRFEVQYFDYRKRTMKAKVERMELVLEWSKQNNEGAPVEILPRSLIINHGGAKNLFDDKRVRQIERSNEISKFTNGWVYTFDDIRSDLHDRIELRLSGKARQEDFSKDITFVYEYLEYWRHAINMQVEIGENAFGTVQEKHIFNSDYARNADKWFWMLERDPGSETISSIVYHCSRSNSSLCRERSKRDNLMEDDVSQFVDAITPDESENVIGDCVTCMSENAHNLLFVVGSDASLLISTLKSLKYDAETPISDIFSGVFLVNSRSESNLDIPSFSTAITHFMEEKIKDELAIRSFNILSPLNDNIRSSNLPRKYNLDLNRKNSSSAIHLSSNAPKESNFLFLHHPPENMDRTSTQFISQFFEKCDDGKIVLFIEFAVGNGETIKSIIKDQFKPLIHAIIDLQSSGEKRSDVLVPRLLESVCGAFEKNFNNTNDFWDIFNQFLMNLQDVRAKIMLDFDGIIERYTP